MFTIFLVEDDRSIRESIARALKLKGYQVLSFDNGARAYKKIAQYNPDLILLDLMMPEMDGLQFIRTIRQDNILTPVLLLTARADLKSKVQALDLGGDDYLAKPFELDELISRVNALIRRDNQYKILETSDENKLEYAEITIEPGLRLATYNKLNLDLTKIEFDLLMMFIKNKNRISKIEDIYLTVWGQPFDKGSKNLNVYVTFLRKKLEAVNYPHPIVSSRGIGYKIEEQH